jgi:hypothetical protein
MLNLISIIHSLARFFFRRIDFLNRSIYITVGAFIAQISVLSNESSLLGITSEMKQDPELQRWQYWSIRLFEVIFIGGDWIIISVLSLLLIGLGFLKYKTREFPNIKHHFNSQLRSIEGLLDDFKPETAFKLLKKFLDDVDDSYLPNLDKRELKAWAYHLMGLCRVDQPDIKALYKYMIESYILQPHNPKYKERACVSYYHTDQKSKALAIANELIDKDGLNERANAIKLICDERFDESQVPESVRDGLAFKRIYINHLLSGEGASGAEAGKVLSTYIEKGILPDSLNQQNLDFWELAGRLIFYLGIQQQPNTFASHKESYQNNQLIKYAHSILAKIYVTASETELYKTSKALRLTLFYYWHSEYLLSESSDSVSEMINLYKSSFTDEPYSDQLYSSILICLNQLHRYEDVLTFVQSLPVDDYYVYAMKYQAYQGLKRTEEAIQSFVEYLKKLDLVGDVETNNLLAFADYLIQNKIDTKKYYDNYVVAKDFSEPLHKSLVFSYFHRYLPDQHKDIEQEIDNYKAAYSELRYELRNAVLVILFAIKQSELVISLIEQFHNWRSEQPAVFIYTQSLLVLRKDSSKIIETLKHRRAYLPEERLLIEEIGIYELMENSSEILEIAKIGRSEFPQNVHFLFYFIYALYKLKNPELHEHLTNELLKVPFNSKEKFILARVCIENNQKVLGLELFYQEVAKNGMNSPMLKQQYFVLTTQIGDRREIPWPETVQNETTVKVSANNKQVLLDINDRSSAENWMVGPLLGLRQGESAEMEDPVLHKKVQVTVLSIFDKFSGLAARIAEEITDSDYTGMGMRSFTFESSTPDGITKSLIENFGEAGDRQKIQRDEALAQYYRGELSFTELVRRISRDEVLEVYSFLTSKQSNGFIVLPAQYFRNVTVKSDSEFVIDFTSLPILMKISEDFPGVLKHKFVISQFAIEILENELAEAKAMQEDGMTLSITSFGVIPTPHPPGYKDYKVTTLQKIIDWVGANCETRVSKDKLDMILQKPDLVKEGDLYFNYFIDTIFISHGRTLISDDRIHNKNFGANYLTISLEYYLRNQYEDNYTTDFLPILIQNHYVGIRVDHEALVREFKRPYYGGVNTFHYCLENLPFPINNDLTVFNEALDFIKYIYIEDSPIEFRRETSQKVLVAALKDYPNFARLRKNLTNEINSRFALLQIYLPMVLEDFTIALEILARR